MTVRIDRRRRVFASTRVVVDLPARVVWAEMRQFAPFMQHDPLHARVRVASRPADALSPRGTCLVISHRFCGIGPDRVGRIVHWREGVGFAFSDLSRRGARRGFPHICGYRLEPLGEERCALVSYARGRWSMPLIPRFLGRAWMYWVLAATDAALTRHFGALGLARRNAGL